jgi:transposase InsO family protein
MGSLERAMPLRERTIMDLREEMSIRALDGRLSVSEIARRYDVSRTTVRFWRARYQQGGRGSLVERSHAPLRCPHKTSAEIEQLILRERQMFGYGSKKILRRIADEHPTMVLPRRSTVDAILRRAGLVASQRRTKSFGESPFRKRYVAREPGELFTIDHKGEFRLRNGKYCYPLTIVDSVSRYVLACDALSSTRFAHAWPVVERIFREHGLPVAMQSDNGPPFGTSQGRVSRFSVQLMIYGVLPVFGRPAKPQDNGSHERMHRDLKREATRPPGSSLSHQQRKFDEFMRRYNVERPHESLQMKRPSNVYQPSPRSFPRRQPRAQYPLHVEKRTVSEQGYIKWRGHRIFLGDPLAGQIVAIEPMADALCAVHFHRFVIGHIDEIKHRFI